MNKNLQCIRENNNPKRNLSNLKIEIGVKSLWWDLDSKIKLGQFHSALYSALGTPEVIEPQPNLVDLQSGIDFYKFILLLVILPFF